MLRFLGSAKFTNGSLNYLVNHLSENIHSAKCKHYKKCKDCKNVKSAKKMLRIGVKNVKIVKNSQIIVKTWYNV